MPCRLVSRQTSSFSPHHWSPPRVNADPHWAAGAAARAGVATSPEYSRRRCDDSGSPWLWRRSQWHSERARLISRHTWCDRERRGGEEGDPADYHPQPTPPSFPPRFSLFFKRNFNLKGQLEEEESRPPGRPPSSPHSTVQSQLTSM